MEVGLPERELVRRRTDRQVPGESELLPIIWQALHLGVYLLNNQLIHVLLDLFYPEKLIANEILLSDPRYPTDQSQAL